MNAMRGISPNGAPQQNDEIDLNRNLNSGRETRPTVSRWTWYGTGPVGQGSTGRWPAE